jgi:hypothetical protein
VVDAVRIVPQWRHNNSRAGRRRSSKACRDGKWRRSTRPPSNVTRSPTSHPSCVSGFCFSSRHAFNSPAAITVMNPRRRISLCSPVHLAALQHLSLPLSLSLSLGSHRSATSSARRLQDAALEDDLPAQICRSALPLSVRAGRVGATEQSERSWTKQHPNSLSSPASATSPQQRSTSPGHTRTAAATKPPTPASAESLRCLPHPSNSEAVIDSTATATERG